MKEYIYYHEQTSTDTRTWNVRTKYKLTDEEVQELCNNHWTDETPTVEGYLESMGGFVKGIRVEYNGLMSSDDTESETRLDYIEVLNKGKQNE
jgi:hypothetical protein